MRCTPEAEKMNRSFHRFLEGYGSSHLLYEGPIVDLGCGWGSTLLGFREAYPNTPIIGIDKGYPDLAYSKLLTQGRVWLVQSDIRRLPFPDTSIPIVFTRLVFDEGNETNYPDIAREIVRILQPGGFYFGQDIAMPNYSQPFIGSGLQELYSDMFAMNFRKLANR